MINITNYLSVKQLGILICLMDSKVNQRKGDINRVFNWLELENLIREVDYGRENCNK